jgi:hypothetical protein
MPNTNPKAIKSLKQKIAAGRQRLYEIYAARGYTDPIDIPDAACWPTVLNWINCSTGIKK